MIGILRRSLTTSGALTVLLVAAALGGLAFGIEPVGGDPDLMYRPIKAELARALGEGRLPWWSDRFGLGVPLVAESHAAALYPPNWAAYRLLDVATAYRLMMGLHHLALAAATAAYARSLGLSAEGAALAAISLTLGGFSAAHAGHEPFYHALPFLPLALLAAGRYAETGRPAWLAGLALAWGAQLTLGHYQIQLWTGALVMILGGAAVLARGRPIGRLPGLALGLAGGLALAALPLAASAELTKSSGFGRTPEQLAVFAYPTGHWPQAALPLLYRGRRDRPAAAEAYWATRKTLESEATWYPGSVALAMAVVGLAAGSGGRRTRLGPWPILGALAFALATMPHWWPEGYRAVVMIPGFGLFRAPGRYTLITGLAVALLAGRGLDAAVSSRRFALGLAGALAIVLAAAAWSARDLSAHPAAFEALNASLGPLVLGAQALAWALTIAGLIAWRAGKLDARALLVLAALELTALFYRGPVPWGRALPPDRAGPTLARLAEEPDVGLVAGSFPLMNVVVRVGATAAYPYLGITPPPPNYLLEGSQGAAPPDPYFARLYRRFGVTHAIRDVADAAADAEVVLAGPDPVLDHLASVDPADRATWTLFRYPGAFPAARAATEAVEVADWPAMFRAVTTSTDPARTFYLAEDRPAQDPRPRARSARVTSWDGRTAVVEHDGTCDLVIRRAHFPGWFASIDGGPERPVLKMDAGQQAVRLAGNPTGRSVVAFRYAPTTLRIAGSISAAALALIATTLALVARSAGRRPPPSRGGDLGSA